MSLVHCIRGRSFLRYSWSRSSSSDWAGTMERVAMNIVLNPQPSMAERHTFGAVNRYAALPWRMNAEGRLEVMLIGSRCGNLWTAASAASSKARTPLQSAERAAFQEAGVIGRVGFEPIGSYSRVQPEKDGSRELWHVTVFGIHVLGTLVSWPHERKRRRGWWTWDEACNALDDAGLVSILRSVTSRSSKRANPIKRASAIK